MSRSAFRITLAVLLVAAMATAINWAQIMSNGQGGAPPQEAYFLTSDQLF